MFRNLLVLKIKNRYKQKRRTKKEDLGAQNLKRQNTVKSLHKKYNCIKK